MHKIKTLFFLILFFCCIGFGVFAQEFSLSDEKSNELLSGAELAWLNKKHTVRVRVADFPPNHFWENGEAKGVSIDLLKVIADKFDFKLKFVEGQTWAEALEDIKETETLDLLPTTINLPSRQPFLNFSQNYLKLPHFIFVHEDNFTIKSPADLVGAKLAIPKKFASQIQFLETHPGVIPVWVKSPLDALMAVASGDADAYVGGATVGQYYIAHQSLTKLKIIESAELGEVDYSYAVRKDWPELSSVIDKGLSLIPFEQRDAIRSKYLMVTQEVTKINYDAVLWPAAAILAIIFVVVVWNWTLRLKINVSTKQLQEYNLKLEDMVASRTDELMQSKSRLEALFASMPSAFAEHDVVFDENGKIVDCVFVTVNEAFNDFVLKEVDMIDRSVKDVLGKFGLQWIELYNKVLEVGHPFVFEHYEPTLNKFLRVYAFQTSKGRFATLFDDVTEENIATQKLLASETCLKEAQRIAKVGNWEYDIKTGNVTCSEGCLRVYGLDTKNKEITMGTFYGLVLSEDLDYVQSMIKELVVDCAHRNFEHRVIYPDNSVHNVYQRCEVIPDENGVPIKVFATVQNVTAWRQVEDELRSSTSLQEKIIEASYCLLANETSKDNISSALRCLLEGVDASRVYIFKNFIDSNGEIGCRYSYEVCAKGIKPQINNPVCQELLYKDGYERWSQLLASGKIISGKVNDFPKEEQAALQVQGILSLVVVPIEINGEWAGFIGFDENSIERFWSPSEIRILKMSATLLGNHFARLEAEKAVRESEARLDMAIQAGTLGLWDWDIHTDEVFTNDIWQTMLGYDPGENLGRCFDKFLGLVHPDDLDDLRFAIYEHFSGVRELYRAEFRMCCSDGLYKWILASGRVIERDSNGDPLRMIGLHFDINEVRRLQHDLLSAKDAAEAANRSKSEFLANMSHEIRTPLNAVMGMVNLIADMDLTEKQNDYLATIDSSAKSLLNILNDVLDLSKIEAGKLTMERIDFSLAGLVKNLTNMFQHVAEEKRIKFDVSIDETVPTALIGDPLRLKQVLINLVNNAMKFTDEGSVEVFVSLKSLKGSKVALKFDIIDTGIGIDKGQCDTLFESFTQADSSTTRRYGGTGLGLSISKRLVEMMNGSIYVESKLGEGSTFSFSSEFLLGGTVDMQTNDKNCVNSFDLSSTKILLVEDSEINQLIMRELLEARGVTVSCALNGQEAVDLMLTDDFDLILMDIHMPVLDGYEATTEIRRLRGNRIPIIALTANAMVDDIEKCRNVGMNDHISKPVDVSVLLSTICKWLKKNDNVFNSQQALDNVAGNRCLLEDLFKQFFKKFSNSTELMYVALDNGTFEELRTLSHSIKGVAGNLGANALSLVAGKIEKEARNGKSESIKRYLEEFEFSFESLKKKLKKEGLFNFEDSAMQEEDFSSDTISMLPVDVLRQLQEALESGDSSQIMQKIEHIGEINRKAGNTLKQLAGDYEYKQIEAGINALL